MSRFRRLIALLAVLSAVALAPSAAFAAAGPVAGGRLDWGIKQSFLAYVTGPVAQGSWALTGGAATVGGNAFRFHSATGSYDPGAGALTASFSGGVRFTGHPGAGGYALDLTVSRITLRAVQGGDAALYADVSSKAKGTGTVTSTRQTRFADLALAGLDLRGAAGTLSIANVPATLSADGAKAFGAFYGAGTPLDPVSLSVNLAADRGKSAEPTSAAPSASSPATPAPSSPATPVAASVTFSRGVLDWGVRRTFRDYVTGSIAQGRWEPSAGAADGGAFFRWTPAAGSYDAAGGTLKAAFSGQVRFQGNELDLTIANPAIVVAGGRGTLSADVSGQPPGTAIATFEAGALHAADGVLGATELPLQLTAEGARAFGGRYPAGTLMDPLGFALALDPSAALPPLPDLGSAPASPDSPSPTAVAVAPAAASRGAIGPPVLAAAGAALAVLTAIGSVLIRRRRSSTTTEQ